MIFTIDTVSSRIFQAIDFGSLGSLYYHVEQLEKSFVEEERTRAYHELYPWFVLPGLLLLVLEYAGSVTLFRRLP